MDTQSAIVPFNVGKFQKLLKNAKYVGRTVVHRTTTDTTMNLAKREGDEGCPDGTIAFAEYQTNPQARLPDRTWESDAGRDNIFTVIVRVKEPTALIFVTAISVVYAIRKLGVDAWPKWPNDILVEGCKLCGILIRNYGTFQSIGVGINVNSDREAPRTSLKSILGREVSREYVLAMFCECFEELLDQDLESILDKYRKLDRLVGKNITISPLNVENPLRWSGRAVDITKEGYLRVEINGELKNLSSEEVSIPISEISNLDYGTKLITSLSAGALKNIITGNWKNQLGSKVRFEALDDGTLKGEYHTRVGNVSVPHLLFGTWCLVAEGGALVSWSVSWDKKDEGVPLSATSWSGRLWIEPTLILKTTYLLTSEVPHCDEWKSVLTNQDQFSKDDNNN